MRLLSSQAQSIECGDSGFVNWLEEWAEDVFALLAIASSTAVMVEFNHAFEDWVTEGRGDQILLNHTKLFFAITATLLVRTQGLEPRTSTHACR